MNKEDFDIIHQNYQSIAYIAPSRKLLKDLLHCSCFEMQLNSAKQGIDNSGQVKKFYDKYVTDLDDVGSLRGSTDYSIRMARELILEVASVKNPGGSKCIQQYVKQLKE